MEPAEPPALTPGTAIGSYVVEKLLGRGGMGEVYLVQDRRLDRPVALKLLPPDVAAEPARRARFEREARLAASLRHPNICTIYEVGEADGQPFIAMEYLEGTTLRDRMAVDIFDVDEVLDLAIQIADALDEAGRQKVVHRDLKSANILLTPRGEAKILDFGLAKHAEPEAGASETETATEVSGVGVVIGTAAYMSPEQALGKPLDARSDLFSFGVILYELLTGRRPFGGKTTMELFSAILHQAPPPMARFNEDVPEPFVRLVGKLLEKDRETRYQSAREVLNDLRKIRTEGSAATSVAMPRRRRPGWSAVAAGVLAVVAVASAGWWWWLSGSSSRNDASIVVLPAQVVDFGVTDMQYLTDAVPATLSSRLAQVSGLDTKIPPTAIEVARFDGDLQGVALTYGAGLYVRPTVLAQGDRLTIDIQVVDTESRGVVWSQEYEGATTEYLRLVRDAAEGVRRALRPASAALPTGPVDAALSEAERALRMGQYYENRFNNLHQPADFALADTALQEAIGLDSNLAEAAAELAWLRLFALEAGAPIEQSLPEAEAWAQQAISVDPRSAKGWGALSAIEGFQLRPSVEKEFGYALRSVYLGPDVPILHTSLGVRDSTLGLSIAANQRARELNPMYLQATSNVGEDLLKDGRAAEALPYLEEVLALEPELPFNLAQLGLALAALGRPADARPFVDRLYALAADGRALPFLGPAGDYAIRVSSGDIDGASALLPPLLAAARVPVFIKPITESLTPFLLQQGRRDVVFDLLEAGIQIGRFPDYDWLVLSPHIAELRTDPRYPAVETAARAHLLEELALMDAARAAGEFPAYLEEPLADLRARLGL